MSHDCMCRFSGMCVHKMLSPIILNQTGVVDWVIATTPTGWAMAAVSGTEKLYDLWVNSSGRGEGTGLRIHSTWSLTVVHNGGSPPSSAFI